ncbi:MAG: ABC transporter substrate-binding protein [Dehalococcoidia bacterium]|nr:ABC transporter substrate-binding protein [Dehalococcoidia bacterium]
MLSPRPEQGRTTRTTVHRRDRIARKFIVSTVAITAIIGLVMAGCPTELPPDPDPYPPMPATGAPVGTVIITAEPDPARAVLKLAAGAVDIYAHPVTDRALFSDIAAHPEIDYVLNYGSYRDIRFNTYAASRDPLVPEFDDGRLNPFAVPAIREAMNWLIDRDFLVKEHLGGMGTPKYTVLGTAFPDASVRYRHIVAAIETHYTYDMAHAADIIASEMFELGAVFQDGNWHYNDEPVDIIALIRSDLSPYPAAGHYVADQLEALGFRVTRLVRTEAEANPIWQQGNPADGEFHFYTGAWSYPAIARDQGDIFDQMYTHRVMTGSPLWQILEDQLTDWPELDEASRRLRANEFATMDERQELFETALWEATGFSNCIWLMDIAGASAYRHNVSVAADLAAGIIDPMWAFTAHFHDEGKPVWRYTLRMETPSLLVENWNPVGGSTRTYDLFVTRALGDSGLLPDTRTGLYWPQRIESAAVTVRQDLPVSRTLDWLTLDFAQEIAVPPEAWADWDAEEQRFITVAERFPQGTTALRKSVVTYPHDLFETPLHDGSTLSMGDFIMAMIMRFDRGKEASPIYDPAQRAPLEDFLKTFKGVRIVSVQPKLVIETYSDVWHIDAERNVTHWFPTYGTHDWTGFWHMITVGWLAEANTEMAFSRDKATNLGVEWTGYTRGPSLSILEKWLDWAVDENFIPYRPTLANYITLSEAAERWFNLQNWYSDMGHFWVSSGPYMLKTVSPLAKIVVLKRFEDYADPSDKWFFLLEPLSTSGQ